MAKRKTIARGAHQSGAITKFLRILEATGESGFEGLVINLLQAATGQRFRIAESGQQDGQDAMSEPGFSNRIKVEAKHYSKPTLSLRDLTGEIAQARSLDVGFDLWVLAASCSVSTQKTDKLRKVARDHNVEILILDRGIDGLQRLVLLMVSQRVVFGAWLARFSNKKHVLLHKALDQIALDPQFAGAVQQLENQLNSTLLGYEDTALTASTESLIRRALVRLLKDEETTKQFLGGNDRREAYLDELVFAENL